MANMLFSKQCPAGTEVCVQRLIGEISGVRVNFQRAMKPEIVNPDRASRFFFNNKVRS